MLLTTAPNWASFGGGGGRPWRPVNATSATDLHSGSLPTVTGFATSLPPFLAGKDSGETSEQPPHGSCLLEPAPLAGDIQEAGVRGGGALAVLLALYSEILPQRASVGVQEGSVLCWKRCKRAAVQVDFEGVSQPKGGITLLHSFSSPAQADLGGL